MSHFKKSIISVVLLIALCVSLFLLVSCGKDDDETPVTPTPDEQTKTDYGIDNVYFMTDGENEYLFTITGNAFLLSGLNGDQSGTFTYADGTMTLQFKEGDTTTASAKIEDGVLTLTYNGGTYRMLQRSQFTVSYDVDGGSAVASQRVLNGEYAVKPQDPTKDGYAFIGWYTDKSYETPFVFDSVGITANTTVYARFVQLSGKTEYKATLVGSTESYAPITTTNGVLYNLPTPAAKDGAAFVGWWMSDYQSAGKLTARYDGQTLTQDVTLYAQYESADAPTISVNAEGAVWSSLGTNIAYDVVVKCGDTVVKSTSVSATRYAFDFAAADAGDYTVTVTGNGKTATAYYRNKGLDRVSNFRVVSSGVLVFDPVQNAQNYVITVVCGNANHKHTAVNNGNSTNYVFANCDMPADGITFVVTAKAAGYLDSVSTYTYFLGLDAVTGVTVDDEKITWNPVANAVGYLVSLSEDGTSYEDYYVTSGTSYDITNVNAGLLYVKVKPVTDGYYAAPAEAVTYTKTVLARPFGVTLSGSTVIWNAVPGAVGYKVTVNGTTYDVTDPSLALTKGIIVDGINAYDVTVQAVAADAKANSPLSETVTVNYSTMTEVTYRDGYLRWSPVLNATKYIIRIGNSGAEIEVPATAAYAPILFSESGEITVSVCSVNENNERSAWVSTTVEVFEILLDVRGGIAVTNLYKAFGDSINLPATTRDGYDFAGWFLTPNSLTSGKEYTSDKFEGDSDLVLYANWSAKKYTVTLNPGENGTVSTDTVTVTYGKLNTLPVAECEDKTRLFSGWFSEPNGAGIRYFDDKGEALFKWNNTADNVTLYAYYAETLQYTLIDNGNAYAVSKGPYGIGNLTEITIPATYNGKPVTTIEGSAFLSCNTLVTINIPNTIESINTGTDGANGTGSCFQGCYKLTAVNIYEVDGAIDPKYFSQDGVLYCTEFGETQVRYCPYAKTGVVTVAEGTTSIPAGAFKSIKVSEVRIPYTVTFIGGNAFYGSSLKNIVFLPTPADVTPAPLVMEEKAIYYCSQLTQITLPSRITEFSALTIASCNALTSIDINGEGGNYSAQGEDGRKVLCTADGTTLVFCPQGMADTFTIPSGIETIGEEAFSGCKSLKKVIIPGYVKTISKNAFKGNSGISEIEMEEEGQPLTICEAAFYSCSGLTKVTLPKRLVKMEVNAFGGTTALTEVVVNTAGIIAEGETTPTVDFAVGAFVTTDGKYSYVIDVTLGDEVPFFDISGVFGKKIQNVNVSSTNPNYSSVDGVLFDKAVTKVVFYPIERTGDYTLPETVTEIGASVFQGRTALTGITIGKNVKTIGTSAFESCSKLAYVTFADNGTEDLTIGDNAFKSCSVLTTINLPTRLKTIGAYAFQSCSKLASLTLPEGLTKIGESAFNGCRALTEVALPSTLEEIQLATKDTNSFTKDKGSCNVFRGCASLETLTIPASNKYYATIDNVLYLKTAKTTGEGEEAITEYIVTTLLYCPQKKGGTTEVVVPGTVTKVAAWAFFANQNVTSVKFSDIADGAEFIIESNAFYGTDSLTGVTLPKGLKVITKELFLLCDLLEEITIPSTVTSIENRAFASCKNLSVLNFAAPAEGEDVLPLVIEDATSYTNSPFYGCYSLKNVVFPERLTVLGNYAFSGNPSESHGGAPDPEVNHAIVSVTLPSTLQRIGTKAFYYARNLTSVTFAAGTTLADSGTVLAIGDYAFYYCSSLTSIELPAGTAEAPYSIGQYAFSRTGLTSVTIPTGIGSLGKYAFFYNDKLTSVTFAAGAAPTLEANAFASCLTLESITLPEGITTISDSLLYNCKKLTSITIPSTVTSIGTKAFMSCESLESVTFATYAVEEKVYSKVASIGDSAFASTALTSFVFPTLESGSLTLGKTIFTGCKELASVTISKSVGDIDGVLAGCSSIKNFTVDAENENFASVEGDPILYNKDKTAYRYIAGLLVGEFRVNDNVKEISANVFENQIALTKLIIPASVTKIGDSAFQGCALLETVVFEHTAEKPSQLASIGTNLFKNCYELRDVTLPGNLTAIPEAMFYYCYKLGTITLPEGLKTIGKNAFYEAGLTTVTIPSSVTTIDQYAFKGALTGGGKLTSVTFATTSEGKTALTTIGNYAFQYQALESFTLPASVTSFGTNVFYGCKNLTTVSLENGNFTTLPVSTFNGCESLTSVTLPTSLTKIDNTAFNGCTALTTITIPDGVTTIGTSSFAGCSSLESIAIPDSVTSLGTKAFKDCAALSTITFGEGSKLDTILAYCFQNAGLTAISIPSGVTVLGTTKTAGTASSSAYQFDGCANLRTVEFKGKLKLLGGYVFRNCTSLESVTFPSTVTQIGNYCFDGCTSLATATFTSGTAGMTIGTYAFRNSGLTAITIPGRVTSVGNYAFDGCAQLETLTFEASTKALTIGTYAFRNSGVTAVTIPGRVTSVGNYAFNGCAQLETLTFEASTKAQTLGTYVFQNCTQLTSVALPDTVTKIPDYAFNGCEALATVTSAKAQSIGNSAFRDCAALTEITLPDTLTSISVNAFMGAGLTSITIPVNCKSIGNNAFGYCNNLTQYAVADGNTTFGVFRVTENETLLMKLGATETDLPTIIAAPGKVTGTVTLPAAAILGGFALNGIQGLTSLELPEGMTEIPDSAFIGASIESIVLPSTLTKIGASAFSGSALKSITIPKGVTEIGGSAFKDCDSLETVIFEEDSELTTLGTYVFAGSGLTQITLPAGVTNLYKEMTASYTFQDCDKLTSVTFLGEITELNGSAFRNCTALKSFTIPETVTVMGTYVFSGSGLESITIPAGLASLYTSSSSTTAASYTFLDCLSLKTVTIAEGVGFINGQAFKGCTALTAMAIPASVTGIGANAFEGCTALESVTFGEESLLASIGDKAFTTSGLTTIAIPASVTTIGASVFEGCLSLTSVTFDENAMLTSIGSKAFKDSTLTTIVLPSNAEVESLTLGTNMFENCANLTSVTLGTVVEKIPASLFLYCTSLASLEIPANITSIGATAFKGSGLVSITIPATVTSCNSSVFTECLSLETVVYEDGCTRVEGSTFVGCTALKSVTLPDTIEYIGINAFKDCTSLTVLEIPASVVSLYGNVFYGWTASQTIRVKAPKLITATWTHGLNNGWDAGCLANIIWDYTAPSAE
ncbi:MAG: leucine-rich repeat protein [Clostridia bacterium]|nr:leucine-rich repeat protein [Clostridia bacterium]MDY6185108.1 leucine-rich repeat protein [Eubacteriales bacterium]